MARATLIDDGTLDTVIRCERCKVQTRFNYAFADNGDDNEEQSYDDFVAECLKEVQDDCQTCPEFDNYQE